MIDTFFYSSTHWTCCALQSLVLNLNCSKGQMEVRTTHTYLVCYLILAALSPTSQVWVLLNASGLTLRSMPAGCCGIERDHQQKFGAHRITITWVIYFHKMSELHACSHVESSMSSFYLDFHFSEGCDIYLITSKMKRMESSSSLCDLWPKKHI